MAQEQKESFLAALAESLGCLFIILLFGGLMVLGLFSNISRLTREAESINKEIERETIIEGELAKLENYKGDDKIIEDRGGNITFTLKVGPDRTRFHFKDGRTKELIGMPKKPMEVGKYYKIRYNSKYNLLIDFELVENERKD